MNHGRVTTSELGLALRYLMAVAKNIRWVSIHSERREWQLREIATDGCEPQLVACERVMYRLFPEKQDHAVPVHHWERLRSGDNMVAQRYLQLLWAIKACDGETLWEIDKIVALLEPTDAPNTSLHLRDHHAPKRREGLRRLLGALSTWEITRPMLVKN